MRHRYVFLILLLSVLLISTSNVLAQEKASAPSSSYRLCASDAMLVASDGREVSGDLYFRGNDTVTVWRNRILLATVAKQDVSAVYKYHNRAGDGAKTGFLLGAAAGTVYGVVSQRQNVWFNKKTVLVASLVGAALGVAFGYALGTSVRSLDRFHPIEIACGSSGEPPRAQTFSLQIRLAAF